MDQHEMFREPAAPHRARVAHELAPWEPGSRNHQGAQIGAPAASCQIRSGAPGLTYLPETPAPVAFPKLAPGDTGSFHRVRNSQSRTGRHSEFRDALTGSVAATLTATRSRVASSLAGATARCLSVRSLDVFAHEAPWFALPSRSTGESKAVARSPKHTRASR